MPCSDASIRRSEEYIFYRFVLPSQLRTHGLYNGASSEYLTEDIVKSMFVQAQHIVGQFADKFESVMVQADVHCKVPPELWFEQWALHSSATTVDQAVVHAECVRLLHETMQAKNDVEEGVHVGL